MTRTAITRLFVCSLVAMGVGLLLLAVAGGWAYASNIFVVRGPDVIGVRSASFGWVMTALVATGTRVMVGACVVEFVAWVGAVVNAARLEDKRWFVVLLVTGLLSLGFVAMVAYVIAGREDETPDLRPPTTREHGAPPADSNRATGPAFTDRVGG